MEVSLAESPSEQDPATKCMSLIMWLINDNSHDNYNNNNHMRAKCVQVN